MRLGKGEGTEDLAFRQGFQELFFLNPVAVAVDDAGGEVIDRDDRGSRAVSGGDLLASNGERAVAEARAAPLFRNRHAVKAHGREALQRLARKFLVAVPARGMRRELLARIAPHRLPDFLKRAGHRSRCDG